ncbi:70 kDa peptidyl-prolyl isomerase-like [Varroa jacobsoni]|uniref:Uncharacterized protein n=1 Tax=Varroa destructor TaxID=109461 RepID=A0A7M7K8Y0_VARDE|nr:70 kDa peptidyl-prolyl isomerase-like [Varroa destructor]XP_022663284.1 70 kDa peptidyl-prolyl isomerase-like [Varroa destructor]XP_022663292.1 70 kDa peptidyl-prolyl isomerase-like [Varroa destructor]XP_022663300.1 70 kDa peptidyl-prolyl isomerase-like [Varroa destructor]XP_022663307.1 70 kDa peptidyl-prolyl isomerase-like [Varroa destructor]XP_022697598.1 70 kDa peptidyl-prolyl isomerase-like [Varroa jacobsoni]XP_022697599.1 70 kDa peptidyl-prolyl isomerase-like [Varroa jacobsoni]
MQEDVRCEVVKKGVEYTIPPDGAVCHLQISNDRQHLFSETETMITLGLASDPERLALEKCIMKMRPGEETRIEIGKIDPSGGRGSRKEVLIKLKHFSGCQIFEMDTTEKWRLANWHKDHGVSLFANEKLEWAFRQFSLALQYIISLALDIPEVQHNDQNMNINQLRTLVYLNMSACQLKVKNYNFAAENASKALAIAPRNPKGLYRRGTALMHLQEYEKAEADLTAARDLEPHNAMIQESIRNLRSRVTALDKKYAVAMKKMFQ